MDLETLRNTLIIRHTNSFEIILRTYNRYLSIVENDNQIQERLSIEEIEEAERIIDIFSAESRNQSDPTYYALLPEFGILDFLFPVQVLQESGDKWRSTRYQYDYSRLNGIIPYFAREAEAAGRALGASVFHWFDEPDGSLEHIPALAEKIAELIRTVQPDVIFCPDPWALYEAHQDHIVTGKAAAQAFLSASLAQYPRGTKTAPWQPGAIGFYFTQNPNTVVDVTDTFETKFAAMALHRSQLNEQLLGLYRIYFSMQGQKLAEGRGFALGEGLKVLSPLHVHCFVEAPGI